MKYGTKEVKFTRIHLKRQGFLVQKSQDMTLFRGVKFPGSRGFFPGKQEAKIDEFPGKSLPGNSRKETQPVSF